MAFFGPMHSAYWCEKDVEGNFRGLVGPGAPYFIWTEEN